MYINQRYINIIW